MAYAAYCEMPGRMLIQLPAQPGGRRVDRHGAHWFVLDIIVHSCDALRVRRILGTSPEIAILRCIPLADDKRVHLEVRLTELQFDDVVRCIIACVPDGEIGHMTPWNGYLRKNGLMHDEHPGAGHGH